jgi:hypothetical protein
MAYVPSETLNAYLIAANVGIWIERLSDARIALVCKIPETAIKATYRGASTTLLMASVRAESMTLLCLGLRIDDEPDRPFKATMINSSADDQGLLVHVLEANQTTLHCLNELNHPILSAWCGFEPATARSAATALKASRHWTLTPESSNTVLNDLPRILSLALDRFQSHVHAPSTAALPQHVGFTAQVPMTLDIWKPSEVFDATPAHVTGPFTVDDLNEGLKLETMILAVLRSLYADRAYLSPHVQHGNNLRELADALAFDERFLCVVQAKALAVLSTDPDQSTSRRVANVTKDINKGLAQLAGAMRKIRSQSEVVTRDGTPIIIPEREVAPGHAILVLSEMYFGVDWRHVARTIATASQRESHRALFHVLDIQELAMLSTGCEDSVAFSSRLIQRWTAVQERGTAYMRSKLPI